MLRPALTLCFLLGASACGKPPALPRYGRVPNFSLQDQRAQPVSLATFAGKVVIADFIFSSCPDVCPLLTEQMVGLRKRLPADAGLAFVSFSVDPEHDTPSKLQTFAAAHGADQPNWFFLTGGTDEVRRVVTAGFKQAMEVEPAQPGKLRNVLHGTHFVLVDRAATIRGFYRSDADGMRELQSAAENLAHEPSGS
jgi:protein SCO1/2